MTGPFRLMIGGLLAAVTIGVVWAIIAGAGGYTLGSPPTGLDAVASCYQVTRVDFVVPMWKATDPTDCGQATTDTSSPTAAPTPPAQTIAPATTTTTTTAAPPPPVSCPQGFQATSWGKCQDQRHLPCPAGYAGWQNSQVDNCLQKPN
jgi:hypothetical protein